jgi:aminocarboxymuconate-semialdehyde decarboxylase
VTVPVGSRSYPAAIDIHGHGVPEEFVAEIVRTGLAGVDAREEDGKYFLTFPGQKPLRPVAGVMMNFGGRANWLDDQDVSAQMVAPWLDVHGQQLPAADGQEWVRLLNNCMAAAVAGTSGRLTAHATVHLADPKAAAHELDRAHSELGMRGCMIPTNIPGGFLDEPRFDALWEAAAGLGVPIILHPPTEAPSSPAFERYPRLRTLARAVDTTIVAAALLTTGVLERYPELKLVLVHGGGYLPYQIGRLDQAFEGGEELLPSEYLRQVLFDTTALTPEAVRMLLSYAGADHVMVGSDYAATSVQPAWPAHSLISNVRQATAGRSGDEDLVLHVNAQRYFSSPADKRSR